MENYDLKHDGDQWKLAKQGAQRASLTFGDKTKEQAIQESAKFMREHPGSVKIHKVNGLYQEERTYPRSADPRRSPG